MASTSAMFGRRAVLEHGRVEPLALAVLARVETTP
jgi:hypothetical protein